MSATCHQCGKPVPPGGLGGEVCPACLWKMSLDGTVTCETPLDGAPEVEGHVIVEEIARGGMGIVYKAQQLTPHREVALKMLLPPGECREDIRERFRVEILALAELDHPRILPLYQAGTTAGRPWFTMKLATGGALTSRLGRRRQPFDPREAATLMAGMADAVHHAHSHGFLHRDIKPANILFDDRGEAYLADFGLAKLLDSTDNVTRSLAVLGTPCYMAPEVAAGGSKSATTASDIYGLGAVLYELLSGRPPFMVEGMAALVKKIVEDEPEHPSTFANNVPRDLEPVCLTCLAKEPRARYATARDVAEDLRRWLRGEPVAARRAGATMRLWAWARRRPALAAVSAALILTVIASGIGLTFAYFRVQHSLKEERAARTRADGQSDFLIGAFADELKKMGRISLIEKACEEAFGYDQPVDDNGYKRRARLLLRWASANRAKGDCVSAASRLREVVETMSAMHARVPSDAEAFTLSINGRCRLAEVLAETTSLDDAMEHLAGAERAVDGPGALPLNDALRLRAEIHGTRAIIYNRLRKDAPEAPVAAELAVNSFKAWQVDEKGKRERTLVIAGALREAGEAWFNQKDFEKALAVFGEGVELLEGLPDRSADEAFELAYCHGWMGDCLLALKGPGVAAQYYQKEFDMVSRLVNQDSLNGVWQFKLANCHFSLARSADKAGDPSGVEYHRGQSRAFLEDLHTRAPDVREWTLAWLEATGRHGLELLRTGKTGEARREIDRSYNGYLELMKAQPASRTSVEGWRSANFAFAEEWKRLEPPLPDETIKQYQRAIAAGEAEINAGRAVPWWTWANGELLRRLADAEGERGNPSGALDYNLKALEIRTSLFLGEFPLSLGEPGSVASAFKNTGVNQGKLNMFAEALLTGEDALKFYTSNAVACRKPGSWASAIKEIVSRCLDSPVAHAARDLARRTAELLYPPGNRPALGKGDLELLEELEKMSTPPPTPPVPK